MLELILRINRQYDDLDEHHGILRLMLCLIPMMTFCSMIIFGDGIIMGIGMLLLTIFSLVRIIGMLIGHQRT